MEFKFAMKHQCDLAAKTAMEAANCGINNIFVIWTPYLYPTLGVIQNSKHLLKAYLVQDRP